jgi:predicted RNA binding protein YcfA (HicA-like mRNA interferase family)
VRPRKTWEAILSGRRAIPFEGFERLLSPSAFEHRRTRGSHHIYRHPRASRPLSIQPKGGEVKPYQIAQFMAMVEEFGLRMEDDE